MDRPIMLDAGPLGMIIHPRANVEVTNWFHLMLKQDTVIIIPEIADYEVRRNLVLENLEKSIARLDQLEGKLRYQPLKTTAMRRAAELWARARRGGYPTADMRSLDADVILAAQAEEAKAVVATENVGHLSRFVEAKNWREIA